MSHHIYQTKAFIVDSTDIGEANKLITLFTPDLGLIRAVAQGVRLIKSKLRPSIQDLSFSKVSLVRGKEVWRLTNAEKLISLYDRRIPLGTRKMMARTLAFLRRLSPTDVKHQEAFDLLSKLYTFCFEQKDILVGDVVQHVGFLAELRLLDALGYGSDSDDLKELSSGNLWNREVVESASKAVDTIKEHITHALLNSHL